MDYDGVPTRVFAPEYLCAVALQTGRAKDYLRVTMFLEQEEVDLHALTALSMHHGIQNRLQRALDELQKAKAKE